MASIENIFIKTSGSLEITGENPERGQSSQEIRVTPHIAKPVASA
jgi:hypothetical protein